MAYATLLEDLSSNGVLTITLNRADKRNAMSDQMIADLTTLGHAVDTRDDVRVVVLRGAGKVFCAGGDLAWMKAQITADRATRMAEAAKLAHMLRALNEMPKPLISVIHGAAMGGGVGLACVSDFVIAENTAKFGLTETRLGLIPATIGPYVIARMGEGAARQVFMSSAIFDSTQAKAFHIVSQIVDDAKPICKRHRALWRPEALAGIDAFLSKTPAPWAKK